MSCLLLHQALTFYLFTFEDILNSYATNLVAIVILGHLTESVMTQNQRRKSVFRADIRYQ